MKWDFIKPSEFVLKLEPSDPLSNALIEDLINGLKQAKLNSVSVRRSLTWKGAIHTDGSMPKNLNVIAKEVCNFFEYRGYQAKSTVKMKEDLDDGTAVYSVGVTITWQI